MVIRSVDRDAVRPVVALLRELATVVAGIDAARSGAPTPCPAFDVAALQQHVLGRVHLVGLALVDPAAFAQFDPARYAGPKDPEAASTEICRVAESVRTALPDGAHPRQVDVPHLGGKLPAEQVVSLLAAEVIAHGWDLAAATGQPWQPDPELCERALAALEAAVETEHRGDGGLYGAPIPVAADAPALVRFLALTGRSPGWVAGRSGASSLLPDDMAEQAELGEAEALFALFEGLGATDRATLGAAQIRLGGGMAVSMVADTTGFWSRTVGLGTSEPVTADVIQDAVDFYRRNGRSRASFPIAVHRLPPEWAQLQTRFGIQVGTSWVKLACDADDVGSAETDLTIRPLIDDDDRAAAVSVLAAGFGMSPEVVAALHLPAYRNGTLHGFGAFADDRLVSVGNLRVNGRLGAMYGAVTRPEYRGRGAQSALLAERARVAREQACRWLIAETYVPQVQGANPSLNNMVAMGFQPLYERTNWRWSDDGA